MNKRLNNIYKFIASSVGLGYAPKAPGTFGALGACLLWVIFKNVFHITDFHFFIITLITFFIGVFVSSKAEKLWSPDASMIVIDEVLGMWVSLLFIPFSWLNLAIAFVLFRFFDIKKPFFIEKTQAFKYGWGVMLDDLLAGIYSNLILQLILLILMK